MAKLVCKTGIEPFIIIEKIGLRLDDIIDNFIYIKIGNAKFQEILIIHKTDLKLLNDNIKSYEKELKKQKKKRCEN